ncbi:cytochrome c family protein [uncultured Novosphingobium sp.]|uniref:c-type cytochrome n=1 Tax=Novosphingobium fluoreni TaxID=1391222 RepID=UPI002586E4DC|nr:cytochrome c family protein [uncultured Novosphingobium sp.]
MNTTTCLATMALVTVAAFAATDTIAAPEPAMTSSGAQVFARSCAMCHTVARGAPPKLGPNLAGVSGRKAGAVPGFRYSPAMAKSGLTWNANTLDAFLTKPAAVVPGNRMGFAGVKDTAQRAALVSYMTSLPK